MGKELSERKGFKMEYNSIVTLKDGRACILRNGTEKLWGVQESTVSDAKKRSGIVQKLASVWIRRTGDSASDGH